MEPPIEDNYKFSWVKSI